MTTEALIDDQLEICDPHHHLWEYPDSVYLVGELRDDIGRHNVTSTVFLECGSKYRTDGPDEQKPVGETQWVEGLPRDGNLVEAIVGFADLTLAAAVEDVLAAHVEAGKGRFRGIRHVSAFDADDRIHTSHTNPPPQLLLKPEFRYGFAVLAKMNLSF